MDVKIYKPSRNTMQSGFAATQKWVLEYEQASKRAPKSLMGWTSSEDTLNQVRLKFDTKEEAICFADKNGWTYTVQPEHKRKIKPRNYVDNFKYIPPKVTEKA